MTDTPMFDLREVAFAVEGRTLLAGEHLSHLNGWQAGAIESAWYQIEQLHARLSA